MGRAKRGSKVLERATRRASSLRSIDPALDLGNGLTLKFYVAAIADTGAKLSAYNGELSASDAAKNDLADSERRLADLSERMLSGVGSKFSKNANEYEKAGGVRKSAKRRPKRTKKA